LESIAAIHHQTALQKLCRKIYSMAAEASNSEHFSPSLWAKESIFDKIFFGKV
jgi:hypothetical protein